MARLQIIRMPDTGRLIATVDGDPIHGAIVKGIDGFTDIGMGVTIVVPLKDATVKEMDNVIPLRASR